jgi:hypothetical protein
MLWTTLKTWKKLFISVLLQRQAIAGEPVEARLKDAIAGLTELARMQQLFQPTAPTTFGQ